MPEFTVVYRPEVAAEDFRKIPRTMQERILLAIERRLMKDPAGYGVRLRQSLAGLWKLRVGDYRVVFELQGREVTVWVIRHRREVCELARRRWR